MNAQVFLLTFMALSMPGLSLGKNKIFTLSVNGPKTVPIRGFLLGHNKGKDFPSLKNVEIIRKIATNNSGRLTSVETNLKSMKQDFRTLKLVLENKGEGYKGCFKDDGSRHLKHKINALNSFTLAKCKQHCKGYTYAGLQNKTQCFCGNQLVNKKYPSVSESECNLPCKAEPKRMCGGAWRNSIYKVSGQYGETDNISLLDQRKKCTYCRISEE